MKKSVCHFFPLKIRASGGHFQKVKCQKVYKSKGLQVKRSPSQKVYKSKVPQVRRPTSQKVPSQNVPSQNQKVYILFFD